MTRNMLSNIIPGREGVMFQNDSQVVYVSGSEFEDESWRIDAHGVHPLNLLNIEHRVALDETDITLTDAKVALIEADGWSADTPYYASVLVDIRADLNVPPALAGTMVSKVIEWDGFLWNFEIDQWFTKASFHNSMFIDRAVMRRMQITNTDPDNGLVYPPVPKIGISLGARFADFEGTIGASMSITTSDGLYGMIPVMVHGAPEAFNITPDSWASQLSDGTVVGVPYKLVQGSGILYTLGDAVIDGGFEYLCLKDGLQSSDFAVELAAGKWAIQNISTEENKEMTSLAGEVMLDSSGNIMRSF